MAPWGGHALRMLLLMSPFLCWAGLADGDVASHPVGQTLGGSIQYLSSAVQPEPLAWASGLAVRVGTDAAVRVTQYAGGFPELRPPITDLHILLTGERGGLLAGIDPADGPD